MRFKAVNKTRQAVVLPIQIKLIPRKNAIVLISRSVDMVSERSTDNFATLKLIARELIE